MCRRCGEPDKRGSVANRRARKIWMLNTLGDGQTVPCTWCEKSLTYATVQADRLVVGGSYRRDNIVPSCAGCNVARSRQPIEEGCAYG